MSIFGNGSKNGSKVVSNNGKVLAGASKLEGYPILSVPSTALQSSAQTIILPQIPNQKGLPIDNMLFQVQASDSNSGSTSITTNPLEDSIYEFILKSSSGEILVDLKGEELNFSYWQHLLNNNGTYTTSPTTSVGAGDTDVATTWVFNLSKYISATDFPLTPMLTLNSLASRGGSTSCSIQLNVLGDFKPVVAPRTKIFTKAIPVNTTGVVDFSTFLPKGISVKQVAFDFGADSSLSTNSTFNFAIGTDYLLQNTSYLTLINKEDNAFPIPTPHISGLFPLFVPKFIESDTTKFNANVSALPVVNGASTNFAVGYWEQYI